MLFAIFCLLLAIDAVTTYLGMLRGAKEVNPVMRWLMDKLPMPVAIYGSHVAVAAVYWFSGAYQIEMALYVGIGIFALVAVNNVWQLRKR